MIFVFVDLPASIACDVLEATRDRFEGKDFKFIPLGDEVEILRPLPISHAETVSNFLMDNLTPHETNSHRKVCLVGIREETMRTFRGFSPFLCWMALTPSIPNFGRERSNVFRNSIVRQFSEKAPYAEKTLNLYGEFLKKHGSFPFQLPIETYEDSNFTKLVNQMSGACDLGNVKSSLLSFERARETSTKGSWGNDRNGWSFELRTRLNSGQRRPEFQTRSSANRLTCTTRTAFRLGCYLGRTKHFKLIVNDEFEFSHFGCHKVLERYGPANEFQVFPNDYLMVG